MNATPSDREGGPPIKLRIPARLARLVPLAALALLFGALLAGPAVAQEPHDNRGTVKIHDGAGEPSPVMRNQPKVCDFHVHGFKFHADQVLTIDIAGHGGPNAGPDTYHSTMTTDSNGEARDPATGSITLADGMYKLDVGTGRTAGQQNKHKVFKVDCAAAGGGPGGEVGGVEGSQPGGEVGGVEGESGGQAGESGSSTGPGGAGGQPDTATAAEALTLLPAQVALLLAGLVLLSLGGFLTVRPLARALRNRR
jgi:hypothetical protein